MNPALAVTLAIAGPSEASHEPSDAEAPIEDGADLEWGGDDDDFDLDALLDDVEQEDEGEADAGEDATATSLERDVLTGYLRLMGGYLHYYRALPPPLPSQDDGLGTGVARMIADEKLGKHFDYEINVFADLSRTPPGLVGGTFATAGSTESAYRYPTLTWSFWDANAVSGVAGADRLALNLAVERVSVSLGRFPVNMSVTNLFTPNDVFAPFSPTAINRIYKPGVDAARFSYSLGTLSGIEAVGALGYDDGGAPSWARSAAIARVSTVRWNFEWAALGGKLAERWIAGGSFQGDLGRFGVRGEGHVGMSDRNADGRLDGDDEKIHGRVSAGPEVTFAWQNATAGAEYAFYSDGGKEPSEYISRAQRFFPDDIPYLGRHYVGVSYGMDIVPIVRISVISLLNAADLSGLAGAFISYSISDEAEFVGGFFAPWGARPSPGVFFPIIESEYGLGPFAVFLETRFYF